eukprot:5556714-Amphidinium_carterae.1
MENVRSVSMVSMNVEWISIAPQWKSWKVITWGDPRARERKRTTSSRACDVPAESAEAHVTGGSNTTRGQMCKSLHAQADVQ